MTYQAIKTKYLGPTNHKGSRMKAIAGKFSLTLEYDDGINANQNHSEAARQLAEKMGWNGRWTMGSLDNTYNIFVCVDTGYMQSPSFVVSNKSI